MANTFKSQISDNIGTTPVDVYTGPALTTATIIGLSIANQHTSQINVDVTMTKGATTVFLVKGAPIPVGSSLVVVGADQKVVVETTDVIKVTSSIASSADVVISVLEIA